MPKYYIRNADEKLIVDAESPVDACVKGVKHYFQSMDVGGYFWVSERGFGQHADTKYDYRVPTDTVINCYLNEN